MLSRDSYHKPNPRQFVKIVYSKVNINGHKELVPFELYSDGSLKRCA